MSPSGRKDAQLEKEGRYEASGHLSSAILAPLKCWLERHSCVERRSTYDEGGEDGGG